MSAAEAVWKRQHFQKEIFHDDFLTLRLMLLKLYTETNSSFQPNQKQAIYFFFVKTVAQTFSSTKIRGVEPCQTSYDKAPCNIRSC